MKGSDEPLCLDVDVKVVEQVDVRMTEDGSDEPLCFDNDVNAESWCHEDVADLTDAAEMRRVQGSTDDGLDEPFCLDDNVLIVEQVDV